MSSPKPVRFFVDFDGTITENDVVDLILERYAEPEWRLIEKKWQDGRIGSRECLSSQVALVSAGQKDLDRLLGEVKIDPYFTEFVQLARQMRLPVTIVSDGFDWVIDNTLQRKLGHLPQLLRDLPVHSNKLTFTPEGPRLSFPEEPCEHGCATCKVRVIERLRGAGDYTVFIGDGLSDRYAAEASDLTFAKSKLLLHCRQKNLRYRPYFGFEDVLEWMKAGCPQDANTTERTLKGNA
ncbi:MAG: 2-hydroxy-3-keto-5-methylthiopentenyl-1-phosphate phosphatase [Candidatus Omnitrophica bacterium]|nr:2-hydroxy-3-keto-5-methylthiopentenyl-1-phosphate phosphatase [Candidatus Omnitrophota bacterium]